MNNGFHRQSSLKDKLRSSICCFTGSIHHHDPLEHGEGFYNKLHMPRTPISPTASTISWFKKSPTVHEYNGEQPRVRGRSIKSRIGRRFNNRQSQSADFSYDPSSYALNFENESPHEEFPFRNFSSRLPASPPSSSSSSPSPIKYSDELPKEIVGYS